MIPLPLHTADMHIFPQQTLSQNKIEADFQLFSHLHWSNIAVLFIPALPTATKSLQVYFIAYIKDCV